MNMYARKMVCVVCGNTRRGNSGNLDTWCNTCGKLTSSTIPRIRERVIDKATLQKPKLDRSILGR